VIIRPARAVTIRPARAKDLAALIDVITTIQRQEFDIPITLAEQPDLQDIDGHYRHGAGEFWVAERARAAVGTIALMDLGDGVGTLRTIALRADARG